MGSGLKVFILAGERSGDRLGGALMAGLRDLQPEVRFDGIGGADMQDQGLHSLFPMEELSVMGLAEILPKYRSLKRRIAQTAQAICAARPDVVISIDSPDFSLRVAKAVRKARPDQAIVHYVAPSVWAWRPGRAKHMAPLVDHVLALLPFEPPYLHAAGISCDFVGHPVVAEPLPSRAQITHMRAGATRVVTLLPGSRVSEIKRMLPVFTSVLSRPNLAQARLVLPTFPHLRAEVEAQLGALVGRVQIVDGAGLPEAAAKQLRLAAMAAGDVALATSGTVSLDLASVGTPMVIAYDMAWLSRQILSRLIKVDTVTLVNLVSKTRAVPEFIGKRCQPDLIAAGLKAVLDDPAAQDEAMQVTMQRLGQGGVLPGARAAGSVLAFLESQHRSVQSVSSLH